MLLTVSHFGRHRCTSEPVEDRRALKRFLQMPARLHVRDPHWVQPLMFERLEHLNPKKNPYFEHAEVAWWLALRDGRAGRADQRPGRSPASGAAPGCDRTVRLPRSGGRFRDLRALFEAAEAWLRRRGIRRATGPFSLSINDESGLLIDGFETPPYLMMGHAPRFYGSRVEEQGYRKVAGSDRLRLRCSRATAGARAPHARAAEQGSRAQLSATSRCVASIRSCETIVDIFNDAWSGQLGVRADDAGRGSLHGQEPEADRARRSTPGSARSTASRRR